MVWWCDVSAVTIDRYFTDLLGGHVKFAFNTLPPALGNIQAGQLRAIAVAPSRQSVPIFRFCTI